MNQAIDQYQITRYPGSNATSETVQRIKELIVDGTRSFPVRRRASEIVTMIPSRDTTGEIRAVFDWIRSHVPFRQDPHALELLETPERALEEIDAGQGYGLDCDGMVIVAGALLQSLGHPIRLVLTGQAPGRYDHIYLEAYSRDSNNWIPIDLAMPQEGFGWYLSNPVARSVVEMETGDLIPGPWPAEGASASGEITPDQLGMHPTDYAPGSVIVTPDGAVWHREGKAGQSGYWRKARQAQLPQLGDVRVHGPGPAEWVGRASSETLRLIRKKYQKYPPEIIHPMIDFSTANPITYILLTQPNVNPYIVRRRFGWKHPIKVRRAWRRWINHYRHVQKDLKQMPEDQFKCADPNHLDGNTAAQMTRHYAQWYPSTPAPDIPGDAPTGLEEFMPGKDLLPDPDEIGGRRDGYAAAVAAARSSVNLKDLIDFIRMVTGDKDVAADVYNTAAAEEIEVSRGQMQEAVFQLIRQEFQPITIGIEPGTIIGIILLAAKIALMIWGMIEAGELNQRQISAAAKEIYTDTKTGMEDAGWTEEGAFDTADDYFDAAMDASDTAGDFEDAFRDGNKEGMALALARQILTQLYKMVRRYGFDSPRASKFRQVVDETIQRGAQFFLLAKEMCIRDLRELKIQALNGSQQAQQAYTDLLAQMRSSSQTIGEWAIEYDAQPWDIDHTDIPGVPSTEPPDGIPPDRYPQTDEDDEWWKEDHPDQDLYNRNFEDELDEQEESGAPGEGRGEAWGVEPGGDTDAPAYTPEEKKAQDVARQKELEKGFIARHPVATTVGVAAAGVGAWYAWKAWGTAIKATLRGGL